MQKCTCKFITRCNVSLELHTEFWTKHLWGLLQAVLLPTHLTENFILAELSPQHKCSPLPPETLSPALMNRQWRPSSIWLSSILLELWLFLTAWSWVSDHISDKCNRYSVEGMIISSITNITINLVIKALHYPNRFIIYFTKKYQIKHMLLNSLLLVIRHYI